MRTLYVLISYVTVARFAAAAPAEPAWASDMRSLFESERTCAYPAGSSRWACNRFVPQAMNIVYGATDFVDDKGNYPLANDIAHGLDHGKWPTWKKLGEATDDAAVKEAQRLANAGQPAVAVWFDASASNTGHVALIIPGDLVPTGDKTKATWKLRKAPCVANWKKDSPTSSFISKGMNFAFSDPKGVILYARTDVTTVAPPPRTCDEIAKTKP